MLHVNKQLIEEYDLTLSKEKDSMIQKHRDVHDIEISNCKMSSIVRRKGKKVNRYYYMEHGKKTPSDYPEKVYVPFQIFQK